MYYCIIKPFRCSVISCSHIKIIDGKDKSYCAGGSPANTIINASILGLSTSLIGTVGDDDLGNFFLEELKRYNINSLVKQVSGKNGISYIFITSDGERTTTGNMGSTREFNNYLDPARIFHTALYETVSHGEKAVQMIDYMKNNGSLISIDLADPEMVTRSKDLTHIIEQSDIIFMTEEEEEAVKNYDSPDLVSKICKENKTLILKMGKKGSIVMREKEEHYIPVYPTQVVSTCGAGDAYASGFLFGTLRGLSLRECGHMGSYIASRVCSSKSSHLSLNHMT